MGSLRAQLWGRYQCGSERQTELIEEPRSSTKPLKLISSIGTDTQNAGHLRPAWIAALLAIEIFILLWAYSYGAHCIDVGSYSVCLIPSYIELRATTFLSAFGL